ncbi:MAG: type III-B CRISPR module RAMP protein Cmr1 [Bacteroidales bacterium]|nr:type III-B CRISPR module RAMP protein Cmr1 [Bacteroidales bacterium]
MEFYIERYKNREELVFDCEVITPMFLSGADPKNVELRSASIKGALRFWWRALNVFPSFKKMLDEESKLFGSANEKSGMSLLKIETEPIFIDSINAQDEKPIYYKDFTFRAIKPNTRFKVKLIYPKDKKELYENLFLIFSIVGGLGKRSRRGFGSFIITNRDVWQNKDEIFNYFNLKESNTNIFSIKNNLTLQYPYLKKVTIGTAFNNYRDLLDRITDLAHKNDCDYTGYAKKRRIKNSAVKKSKRFASPLYISCYKIGSLYYPIITELNIAFDPIVIDINKNNNKIPYFVSDLVQGGR